MRCALCRRFVCILRRVVTSAKSSRSLSDGEQQLGKGLRPACAISPFRSAPLRQGAAQGGSNKRRVSSPRWGARSRSGAMRGTGSNFGAIGGGTVGFTRYPTYRSRLTLKRYPSYRHVAPKANYATIPVGPRGSETIVTSDDGLEEGDIPRRSLR